MIYIMSYTSYNLFFVLRLHGHLSSISYFYLLFFYSNYLSSLQLQTIFPLWLFILIILITIYLMCILLTFHCSPFYATSISSIVFFYPTTLYFGLFLMQTPSFLFPYMCFFYFYITYLSSLQLQTWLFPIIFSRDLLFFIVSILFFYQYIPILTYFIFYIPFFNF